LVDVGDAGAARRRAAASGTKSDPHRRRFVIAYALFVLVIVLQLVVLAQGTDALGGHGGRVGVQAVFFAAAGGYAYAFCAVVLALAPWAAIAISAGVICGIALIVGALFLRLRSNDFLLASLAVQLGFTEVANNLPALGGPLGIRNVPAATPFVSGDPGLDALWIFAPAALAVSVLLGYALCRARFGIVVHWIRDDVLSAAAIGIPVRSVQMTVFMTQALFAALAGIGLVISQGYVSPDSFDLSLSVAVLTVVYVSGTGGWPVAMFAGALVVVGLSEAVRVLQSLPQLVGPVQQIVVNALLIGVLVLRPRGLAGPAIEAGPSATILK
jgi:branched-chain amino acid transport system permease protein